MPLTDLQVRKAASKDRDYKLFDGEGLYVLVKTSGSKLWRMKYRFARRERSLSIGPYPQVSLAEAREQRFAAKGMLSRGIDPSARKQEEKRLAVYHVANSFKAVAEDWHGTNKAKWSPDHAKRLWRRLELYAFPEIGSRPVASIKTPDLIALLRKLEKRGTRETSYRLVQTLKVVFRYAVHCGLIDQNPASDLRGVLKPHKTVSFPTIKAEELPTYFDKLVAVKATDQNKIAVLLLMLTFLRPGELRHSKWADIDFDTQQWRIHAERMKMRRPHFVPLCSQAISLLYRLQELSGRGTYLFPSQQRRKNPYMSENTINDILKRMGYKGRQVGHGFRSLASTTLNEQSDFDKDAIEVQLSHLDKDRIRGIYNRAEYIEERVLMMQWWGDFLNKAGMCHVFKT